MVATRTAHVHLVIGEYRLRGANDGNTRMTLELFDDDGNRQITRVTVSTMHARVITHFGDVEAELDDRGAVTHIFLANNIYPATTLDEMSND